MPWPLGEASNSWCTREDLNLNALRQALLRRLRLPFRHECVVVIPGLVPGIHLSARSGACAWLDPGDKHRDDRDAFGMNATSVPKRSELVLAGGLEPPPLAYKASALPDELSQPGKLTKGSRRRSRFGSKRA